MDEPQEAAVWRADGVLLKNNMVLPTPLELLKSHGVVDV
jgi:hypothetical protein